MIGSRHVIRTSQPVLADEESRQVHYFALMLL
jgi:hypothetical protein